ncbi:glutamate 5-kinase-like [Plakobranchus ocellatus]|uniref:Isopentenyl phosphate kinase n=1 Tax=Plakobranchus ocellatus TaxID=259542 RepID=A0AAV4CW88_9GAST|nr:glutamate 5-kinase-like [Plakobranchus ocellatus]
MLPKIDAVIKIGGSAVTNKSEKETLKPGPLQKAAECIRQCHDSGITCVVVHGAGSFGHHHAREFKINKGLPIALSGKDRREKILGYSLTRQSVQKLNQVLVNALLELGVPAIAFSPGDSWLLQQRELVRGPTETVGRLLKHGFVPVLHGDLCMDDILGFSILSGDTVIKKLCSSFDVKRVVFLTDVCGIYDRPPSEPDAQFLPSICVRADGTVTAGIKTSQSQNDVTGGILLKLNTAFDIVKQSEGRCPVFVCAVDSSDAPVVISTSDVDSRNVHCTKISMLT